MRRSLLVAGAAALAVASWSGGARVDAQSPPKPPHRFFGKASLNGALAPTGTRIDAYVGDTLCGSGQTTNNASQNYVVDVANAAVTPGCGTAGSSVTFRIGGTAATPTGTYVEGGFQSLDISATSAPSTLYRAALLSLADPRPCIPEVGDAQCTPERNSLWNGEADAWARRGVTNPDDRFNETVVFRVRASDPAVIAIIARFLEAPYLQITRVQFSGSATGQTDEYVEVTNLGGGDQEMTGWTVRSPGRDRIYRFPNGFVMTAGRACRIYTGSGGEGACGLPGWNSTDVWPDDQGRAVLYYDALDLPGADTRYSADSANQPPPPNLIGVSQ